jgi:hypothetical protein
VLNASIISGKIGIKKKPKAASVRPRPRRNNQILFGSYNIDEGPMRKSPIDRHTNDKSMNSRFGIK